MTKTIEETLKETKCRAFIGRSEFDDGKSFYVMVTEFYHSYTPTIEGQITNLCGLVVNQDGVLFDIEPVRDLGRTPEIPHFPRTFYSLSEKEMEELRALYESKHGMSKYPSPFENGKK